MNEAVSQSTDDQMKLEAASLASSSGLCQKGIYAEETQQKPFLSLEPKARKDKSMAASVHSSWGACFFTCILASLCLCAVDDAEKQRETSASGARNSPLPSTVPFLSS